MNHFTGCWPPGELKEELRGVRALPFEFVRLRAVSWETPAYPKAVTTQLPGRYRVRPNAAGFVRASMLPDPTENWWHRPPGRQFAIILESCKGCFASGNVIPGRPAHRIIPDQANDRILPELVSLPDDVQFHLGGGSPQIFLRCLIASFPWASIHSEVAPGVPNSPMISVGMDFSSDKTIHRSGEVNNVTQCRIGRSTLLLRVTDGAVKCKESARFQRRG
jgi:hypothetical protein